MKVNLQDVASINNFQNTLKLGITFKHLHGFTKKVRLMVHKCFTFGFRDYQTKHKLFRPWIYFTSPTFLMLLLILRRFIYNIAAMFFCKITMNTQANRYHHHTDSKVFLLWYYLVPCKKPQNHPK